MKTVFISLIGHIAVFSIFSLSFGSSVTPLKYSSVTFWGQFLPNSQVTQPIARETVRQLSLRGTASQRRSRTELPRPFGARNDSYYYLKPQLILAFNTEKKVFINRPKTILPSSKRKEPVIIFHPLLPYSFLLYFKDRQTAHIELMFKIAPMGLRNSIAVKRKISSGNLEADLLTMRYIGHYLFIQQTGILANNWQTVKIDLSAKND